MLIAADCDVLGLRRSPQHLDELSLGRIQSAALRESKAALHCGQKLRR
jgi:hypothetical protein